MKSNSLNTFAFVTVALSAVVVIHSPAEAQTSTLEGFASQVSQGKIESSYAQFRRGYRGYYGRRYYGRGYYRRRGIGTGALIGGLAAGALIGGAIASQAAPAPQGDATTYCLQRFRSYDPSSGTYLGNDGDRHACP